MKGTSSSMGISQLGVFLILCAIVTMAADHDEARCQWLEVPLLPNVEFIHALSVGEEYVFAAMMDSSGQSLGLHRAPIDAPGDWEALGHSDWAYRTVLVVGAGDDYVFVPGSGATAVWWSTDSGASWAARDSGIDDGHGIWKMDWNGNLPGRIYATSDSLYGSSHGIYASSDMGASWTRWELCDNCAHPALLHMAVPKDGSLVGYMYTDGPYGHPTLYKSTDGGEDWWIRDQQSGTTGTRDFAISFEEPWKHFASSIFAGILWYWDDQFELPPIWPPLQDGGIARVETAQWAPDLLFVAGVDVDDRLSVVCTSYPWESWSILREGLPEEPNPGPDLNGEKFHLVAAPHDPILFYAAWGQGLWMRDMRDVVGVPEQDTVGSTLRLSRPVPNPTAEVVEVLLSSPVGIEPVVQVVDVQGRVVAKLAETRGGRYLWDGRAAGGQAVAAGAYFVRARVGAESATRMVILAR